MSYTSADPLQNCCTHWNSDGPCMAAPGEACTWNVDGPHPLFHAERIMLAAMMTETKAEPGEKTAGEIAEKAGLV